MTVRAAVLMTTALLLVPVALGDVVPPPKPEPAAPATAPTVPATTPTAPAAPAGGGEGGGGKVEPGASGDPAAPAEPAAAEPPNPRAIAASSLVQRDGTHDLGGNARIVIAEGFAYLGAADTRKLLTEVWGNPPDVSAQALGAIVPKGVSPRRELGGGHHL